MLSVFVIGVKRKYATDSYNGILRSNFIFFYFFSIFIYLFIYLLFCYLAYYFLSWKKE